MSLIILVLSLILLMVSADKFISGSCAFAKNNGISPFVIGVLIVAIGSSLPEVLVSLMASLEQKPNTAVGNALGSNIANLSLVLAITAIYKTQKISPQVIKKEIPIFLAITFLASFLLFDAFISSFDGIVLTLGFSFILYSLLKTSSKNKQDPLVAQGANEIENLSNTKALIFIVFGLGFLLLSSKLFIYSATDIARMFGISELVIGLSVIAIGTSLPELASCIAGARKNESDLVIGNILGSNIFNLVLVLPMPAFFAKGEIDNLVTMRDIPFMLFLSILFFICAYFFKKINFLIGLFFLLSFVFYQYLLFKPV